MKTHAVVALSASVLMLVGQSNAGGAKADKEKLQGTWNLVGAEGGGKPLPDEFIKEHAAKLTIKADKMFWKTPKDEDEGTYQLDAAKKPKEIDITTKQIGKAAKGIYLLEGDDLRICIDISGKNGRPTEFKTKEGSTQMLYIFKRAKS